MPAPRLDAISGGRAACTVPTSGNGQAEAWCCLQDEGVEGAQGPASLGHRVPPTPTPPTAPFYPFYLPPLWEAPGKPVYTCTSCSKPFRRVSVHPGGSIASTRLACPAGSLPDPCPLESSRACLCGLKGMVHPP